LIYEVKYFILIGKKYQRGITHFMDNQSNYNQHNEGRLINFRCFFVAGICAALGIFGVSRIYMGVMFWGVAALVGGAGIIIVALVWIVKSGL